MIRKIIQIDEAKCNGCGLCVSACHEAAIEIINGKAKVVSDEYCDGLGNCLPECPTNAINIIEKDTIAFDEDAVNKRKASLENKEHHPKPLGCGCPGTMAKTIQRKQMSETKEILETSIEGKASLISELRQWPIQLRLINSRADYLDGANLLVAADCTAFAYADFHKDFIKQHITVIACPKLDDNHYNTEKLTEILVNNNIKSITVVRMEVPCCAGIISAVRSAMLESKVIVPYREVIISTDGQILDL